MEPKKFCSFIQIDALFYKKSIGWVVVEVKSRPQTEFDMLQRVSSKQARRLGQFLEIISAKVEEPVEMHLAVVSHEHEIELYENFLCDLISI